MFKGIVKVARRSMRYSAFNGNLYSNQPMGELDIEELLYNVPRPLRPLYVKTFRNRITQAYGLPMNMNNGDRRRR